MNIEDMTFFAIICKIRVSTIIPGADLFALVAIYVKVASNFFDGN